MYHIVEFSDFDPKEVEIVPSNWLLANNTYCRWPNYKFPAQLVKMVVNRAFPTDDWEVHKVQALKTFDFEVYHEEALKKPKEPEPAVIRVGKSTPSSDADTMHRRKRKVSSSSSEESVSTSLLPSAPAVPQQQPGLSNPQCSCNKYLLNSLKKLEKDIESMGEILKKIIQKLNESASELDIPPDIRPPVPLPLNDPMAVELFEAQLSEDEVFKQTIMYLASFGGRDVKQTVYNILRVLLTREACMQFNWAGRGTKIGISQYEKFLVCIYSAVKRNPACTGVSRLEVSTIIKNYLRFAPDRDGGRSVRRMIKDEVFLLPL